VRIFARGARIPYKSARGTAIPFAFRRMHSEPTVPASPSPSWPGVNRRLGLVQVHIAAFLVGFPGLFSRWLDLSPGMITLGRTVVGSMALLIFAVCTRTNLRIRSRRDALMFVLSGAALAFHWFAFFQSIEVSTVAVGLLAFSTFPIFVTFLEPIFFGERLHGYDIATAVVVTAGLAVIAPILDLGNHLTQGVLWGVLCAFACALLSLLSRSCVRTYPPVAVAFYQQAFAAVFSLPVLFFFHGQLTGRSIALLLLLGILFTAMVQALVVSSLQHIRAQVASVVIALEPVYGILFAILLLKEIPSVRTVIGGALICGAVFWASFRHGRAPAPQVV
jgi:drug/metabolite transporter (DMT)-like permease